MKISIRRHSDLPPNVQARLWDIKDHNFLVVEDHRGNLIRVEADTAQATFYHELSWVKEAIEQAYQLGLQSSAPVNEWVV